MNKEFRFFDSRQKYLLFVTTTNEKNILAERITSLVKSIIPKKPALKIFDAGLGDGTLLMNVLRNCHREFPSIPFLICGKEISMEDVRLTIEKLSDRFVEHPNMVFVVTNLHYTEASSLSSKDVDKQKNINWDIVKLKGNSSFEFNQQLNRLDNILKKNWQVERHKISGNTTYKDPSVLIIYRQDYEFSLEQIIPAKNNVYNNFDLIIASQPYRSRIAAKQKVDYVIKPMVKSLSKGGKLFIAHSFGNDAAMEIISKVWPNENPFPNLGKEIIKQVKNEDENNFLDGIKFNTPEILKYNLRALPNEIENGISTSLLFSSWNATTYVGQISNKKILEAENNNNYINNVHEVIKKYDGLWFNDEIIVAERLK